MVDSPNVESLDAWAFEPQRITVDLKQGANKLLFKVHNIYGPSWLRARIADPERALEFSRLKTP